MTFLIFHWFFEITFNTFNMLWHTYHLMVWLESPESQLSRCFFKIENRLNIKKVVSKNVMSPYNVFWVSFDTFDTHSITALTVYFELLSTPSTYIAYNPYSVFWVSFDTFNIHSITALTVYLELLSTPLTYIAFDQLFIVQYSILHLQHLQHQSVCLIHSIVDSNSKYLNYMKFQFKALNYNKLPNNSLN